MSKPVYLTLMFPSVDENKAEDILAVVGEVAGVTTFSVSADESQDDVELPDGAEGFFSLHDAGSSLQTDFEKDLERLINYHSEENESGTPDFILAEYLTDCLATFNKTVQKRAEWRAESVELPALKPPTEEELGRDVPLLQYIGGRRNELGRARLRVTPGEVLVDETLIAGVVPIFGQNLEPEQKVDLDTWEPHSGDNLTITTDKSQENC